MAKMTANPRNCCIEFLIKDGLIREMYFLGKKDTKWQKYHRKEEDKIKWGLSLAIQDDFEAFIQILRAIKDDEKIFLYGKNLLDSERKKWEHILERYQQEAEARKQKLQQETQRETKRLQEMVDKYTWLE